MLKVGSSLIAMRGLVGSPEACSLKFPLSLLKVFINFVLLNILNESDCCGGRWIK